HFYWCLGSVMGIALGESSGFSWEGIEFSLTALFVVLTLELFLKNPSKKPFYLALLVGVGGLLFFPSAHMLILSILTVVGLLYGGYLLERRS
ncbi:MAG: branched-chain amino acid ABC transporter permease, partial [Wolinella sp.]